MMLAILALAIVPIGLFCLRVSVEIERVERMFRSPPMTVRGQHRLPL